MKRLYKKLWRTRLDRVAEEIGFGKHVVDLCAGDCAIFTEILSKRAGTYTAVDMSPEFIAAARKAGAQAELADVRTYQIPPCDCVLCLESLFQFPEHVEAMVQQARSAATLLIVLEPIKNVASSNYSLIRWLAAKLTDFGEGPVAFRFSEDQLRSMWSELGISSVENLGRDLLGIWRFDA